MRKEKLKMKDFGMGGPVFPKRHFASKAKLAKMKKGKSGGVSAKCA